MLLLPGQFTLQDDDKILDTTFESLLLSPNLKATGPTPLVFYCEDDDIGLRRVQRMVLPLAPGVVR